MNTINCWTNWQRLEEVWLGDVYPESWYEHLDPQIRDCFQEITQITKEDLTIIEKKLEEFGVIVQRPVYNCIDDAVMPNGYLIKPEITPRDDFLVFGNSLFYKQWRPNRKKLNHVPFWDHVMDQYQMSGAQCIGTQYAFINGANCVKAGKDIYFDLGHDNSGLTTENFAEQFPELSKHISDLRVNIVFNQGHIDGCFAVLRPEVIIACNYFNLYNETFPGWQKFFINQPEFGGYNQRTGPHSNHKWWVPNLPIGDQKAFNNFLVKHAQTWIGDYRETYFEINCLVIDENNVMMLGENEKLFNELGKLGINVHSVPFRTRSFWDGGLHCLTLDIRRTGTTVDLFPERQGSSVLIYR